MEKTLTTTPLTIGRLVISVQVIRSLGFVTLDALFLTAIFLLARKYGEPTIVGLDFVAFILATMRAAHTVSFNEVAEPLRAPFTYVKKDSCKAGDSVEPKPVDPERKITALRYVIGALLSCPICSGTWSALGLYTAWTAYPTFGRVLVYVLAFAGGSEVLHWGTEILSWGGRAARVYSGSVSPDEEEE